MDKLKQCPFCGGNAVLKKTANGYRTAPTTIMDEWTVSCINKCCTLGIVFKDLIYHDDNGEIIVECDGAKEATEAWNQRECKR